MHKLKIPEKLAALITLTLKETNVQVRMQSDFTEQLERLKWAGHLARINDGRCCKKIFLAKPMGNRPGGRPPLRWIDCVEKDLKILKVKNWKRVEKS
ncbi:hypothetical protein TNCV_973341 [Trichonephila clavipes]|nr:hypothetical protein TNCV_973341 [Trichonephila clavipes]